MTTLTATWYRDAGDTMPPRIQVGVNNAPPIPTTAYSSNFATTDGWSDGGSGSSLAVDTAPNPDQLVVTGAAGSLAEVTVSRTIGSLTVGARYRFRIRAVRVRGEVKALIRQTTTGTILAQTSYLSTDDGWLTLTATAAQTTFVIQLVVRQTSVSQRSGQPASSASYRFDQATVLPVTTWQGLTITRTDVNGVDVPVRTNPGQDVTNVGGVGQTALTDFEAALVGVVTYRVVDGLGGTATASTVAGEARRNLADDPRMVSGGDAWTGTIDTTGGLIDAGSTYCEAKAGSPGLPVTWSADFTAPPAAALYVTSSIRGTLGGTFAGASITAPTVTIPAGQTQRVTVSGTLLDGVDGFRCQVQFAGWTNPGGRMDRVLIETTATGGTYFDGDSDDAVWTGTVNNSPSVELDTTQRPWITVPATAHPGFGNPPTLVRPEMVTGYEETSDYNGTTHTVIGREDEIVNPGPLQTRRGRIEALFVDYPEAKAARDLARAGKTLRLLQAQFPGLDLAFFPSSITLRPTAEATSRRRWMLTMNYTEEAMK